MARQTIRSSRPVCFVAVRPSLHCARKEGPMIPAPFDYHRPGTLDEAVALLARHGDTAKVLSGGMSLLPVLKLRLGAVEHLVDIGRIPGLDYVKEDGGVLKIGGATKQAALERSELDRGEVPDPPRRGRADRRPAGAEPRDGRRQPRERRPGQRSAGDHDRARRHARRARAQGRAQHPREPVLQGDLQHRARPRTRSSPRCACRSRRRAAAGPISSSSARSAISRSRRRRCR